MCLRHVHILQIITSSEVLINWIVKYYCFGVTTSGKIKTQKYGMCDIQAKNIFYSKVVTSNWVSQLYMIDY